MFHLVRLLRKVLTTCLCTEHSVFKRNPFPEEKCPARILLQRAPTGKEVFRQYTVWSIMNYIMSSFSENKKASQGRLFNEDFKPVFYCVPFLYPQGLDLVTKQSYNLGS